MRKKERGERVEQMKSQVINLQAKNKNMNRTNTIVTKAKHYQELIKKIKKEKDMKQILVTDTEMSMKIQKIASEIRWSQREQKKRSKEIERLKTEIILMESEQQKY